MQSRALTSKSFVSFLAALATIAAGTGLAATSVAIYSTVVNSPKNQLTIEGNNFSPSGLAPTVAFAHTPLVLASFTKREGGGGIAHRLQRRHVFPDRNEQQQRERGIQRHPWSGWANWTIRTDRTTRTCRASGCPRTTRAYWSTGASRTGGSTGTSRADRATRNRQPE